MQEYVAWYIIGCILVALASPVIEIKVYTIPYMHPLLLGKEFPWILWVVYQQLERDMTIFLW
jgi:hypothetical protein